jgi:6-phosphogluconolactonase
MGEDGHTASLFPKTKALDESKKNVVKNYVPQLDTYRISLTYPIIKEAKEAIVLIRGKRKREIVNELYSTEVPKYPIYELVQSDLNLSWIITE